MDEPTKLEILPHEDERLYCQRIHADKMLGARFTFLFGAGISVGSGFPAGPTLTGYLAHCLRKLLFPASGERPWNPREDPFPPPEEVQRNEYGKLQSKLLSVIQSDAEGFGPSPLRDRWVRAAREVWGDLIDWRKSLQLLARLKAEKDPRSGHVAVDRLEADYSVIDRFFNVLSKDREPCQVHRMIVSLSKCLATRLVLTTNFDDFLERAYSAIGEPLEIYEVHRQTALPSLNPANTHRALVKMHGGRYGLRADLTLDENPKDADLTAFAHYFGLRQAKGDTSSGKYEGDAIPQVLLVAGYSASDTRITRLIQHLIYHHPRLTIYWIAYNKADTKGVTTVFDSTTCQHPGNKLHLIRTKELGFFLMGLFQTLTAALPASGLSLPALWSLPSPPLLPRPRGPKEDSDFKYDISNRYDLHRNEFWELIRNTREQPINRVAYLLAGSGTEGEDCVAGATTLASDVFYDEDSTGNAIWLDLHEIAEPVGIFYRLAVALGCKAGAVEPFPIFPQPQALRAACATGHEGKRTAIAIFHRALSRTYRLTGRGLQGEILVFLNARTEPGLNALVKHDIAPKNAWYDDNQLELLRRTLDYLANSDGEMKSLSFRFTFIVIGRTKCRWLREAGLLKPKQNRLEIQQPISEYRPSTIQQRIAEWVTQENAGEWRWTRWAILMAIAAFRFPCFPALLFSVITRGWLPRNPPGLGTLSFQEFQQWMTELEHDRIVRFKPGGVVFCLPEVRNILREEGGEGMLGILWEELSKKGKPPCERVEAHLRVSFSVSRAYAKLQLNCVSPIAGLEAAMHGLLGLQTVVRLSSGPQQLFKLTASIQSMLRQLVQTVNVARRLVKNHGQSLFLDRHASAVAAVCVNVAVRLAEFDKAEVKKPIKRVTAISPPFGEELRKLLAGVTILRIEAAHARADYQRMEDIIERDYPKARAAIPPLTGSATSFPGTDVLKLTLASVLSSITQYALTQAGKRIDEIRPQLDKELLFEKMAASDPASEVGLQWLDWAESNGRGADVHRLAVQFARYSSYLLVSQAFFELVTRTVERFGSSLVCVDVEFRDRSDAATRIVQIAKLEGAKRLCHGALSILRNIDAEEGEFMFSENARLRIQLGYVEARLARLDMDASAARARFEQAEGLMMEAQGFIEEFPLNNDPIESVSLFLRRAQVFLYEADCIAIFGKEYLSIPGVKRSDVASVHSYCFVSEKLRDVGDELDNARIALEKARKGIWNWSRYLHIRGRVIVIFANAVHRSFHDKALNGRGKDEERRRVYAEWEAFAHRLTNWLNSWDEETFTFACGSSELFLCDFAASFLHAVRQLNHPKVANLPTVITLRQKLFGFFAPLIEWLKEADQRMQLRDERMRISKGNNTVKTGLGHPSRSVEERNIIRGWVTRVKVELDNYHN